MKAIYKQEPDCTSCMRLGWAPPEACPECLKIYQNEEVEVIKLGVGIFGNKAVIKKSDGHLKTVTINELMLKEAE